MQNIRLSNITLLSILLAINYAGWATDGDSQTAYENLMQISGSPLQELPDELQLKIHGYVAHDGPVAWTRLMATNQKNCALVKGEEEGYIQLEMKHLDELDENARKLIKFKNELSGLSRPLFDMEIRNGALSILKKITTLEESRSPDFPNPFDLFTNFSYLQDPLLLSKKRFMESKKKEIQEFNQQIEEILQEASILIKRHIFIEMQKNTNNMLLSFKNYT